MDNIILIGSGVIILLMIVGGFIMIKDQTAPIGNPNKKKNPSAPGISSVSNSARKNSSSSSNSSDFSNSAASIADYEEKIREKLSDGRPIEAIKILREQTGLGLKEAKDVIDGMANGRPMILPASNSESISADVNDFSNERIKALLRQGKKIEAIKELREASGLGLAEATTEIQRIEREL